MRIKLGRVDTDKWLSGGNDRAMIALDLEEEARFIGDETVDVFADDGDKLCTLEVTP